MVDREAAPEAVKEGGQSPAQLFVRCNAHMQLKRVSCDPCTTSINTNHDANPTTKDLIEL
jgi:hypothetical protein